jgi:hypothetical protein
MHAHNQSIQHENKKSDSNVQQTVPGYASPQRATSGMSIQRLQSLYGNKAVQRMVQTNITANPNIVIQRFEDKDVSAVMKSMYNASMEEKDNPEAEEKVRTILRIAEETGFYDEIYKMALSGHVLNPDGFYKTITAFNAKAKSATSSSTTEEEDATKSSKGFIRELLFALEQISQGNQVQFGTMKPDHLVDALSNSGRASDSEMIANDESLGLGYEWGGDTVVWGKDKVETRQHKVIEGKDIETVKREIIKAVKQLEGQNGEVAVKDSVRIADIVIMPNNEINKLNEQEIRAFVSEVLSKNTFRKKPLYAFVNSVQITTESMGQLSCTINRENGEVNSEIKVSDSSVVSELQKRDPVNQSVAVKKPAVSSKKPVIDYDALMKQLNEDTRGQQDGEMDEPKEIQERIQILDKLIKDMEDKKQVKLLLKEGVKEATQEVRKIKGERGKWIGQAKRAKSEKKEDVSDDLWQEAWKVENKGSAELLEKYEATLNYAEEEWKVEHTLDHSKIQTALDRREKLQKRIEVVKKEIQEQESAKIDRNQHIDKMGKLALQEKYADVYEEDKANTLDEKWRTEDPEGYKIKMSELQKEWEMDHEKDGMAEKANKADDREREGTGKNKLINERKRLNRIEEQKVIDVVKKDNEDIFLAVTAIIGKNDELCNTMAAKIGKIRTDSGNRKAVTSLISEVAKELQQANDYASSKKLDLAHLKKFTIDLCKGGEYVNFQGNLAELRHANREAEKLEDETSNPVLIGTEDWDMDRLEGKKQEVDVSYIDKDGILHLHEVAWDIGTLEDKLFGEKKKPQREGYDALVKKYTTPTTTSIAGVQMSYAVESVQEGDIDLIFTKIPKGQSNTRGAMAKYLIQNQISLYMGSELFTPSNLQQKLEEYPGNS